MKIEAINLGPVTDACGSDCPSFVAKWSDWWAAKTREPVALLDCRGGFDAYMERIGSKSRNMVRKSERTYEFYRFVYNDWLDDIDSVNRSKPVRQGQPMQGWYTRPAQPATPARLCGLHEDVWIGGFERESGRLYGYAHVEVLNDLAILNSILGHADGAAVVNGLIAFMVRELGVGWINYLYPEGRTQSLTDFKRRVGFRPVTVARVTSGVGASIPRPAVIG